MRLRHLAATSLLLTLVLGVSVQAQDRVKEVIDKAVKAHGGKEKLAKLSMTQSKSTGTLANFGGINFGLEATVQLPKRFKEKITYILDHKKKTEITTVFDDGQAKSKAFYFQRDSEDENWEKGNPPEETIELKPAEVNEIKEALHLVLLSALAFVDNKDFTLTALPDSTVDKDPVAGIKVACRGFRDVEMYFSKDTGLLAKMVSRKIDPVTKKEAVEERIITEYQEADGAKTPLKVVVKRDGKDLVDVKITEIKLLDKVNDSDFAKP